MNQSRVRSGKVSEVFAKGQSKMYTCLARVCVVYEDLKIETGRLFSFSKKLDHDNVNEHSYEILYYIRRSMVSLQEYQGALTMLYQDQEFQKQFYLLETRQKEEISQAQRYLVKKKAFIAAFRNDIGGHMQHEYVRQALADLEPEEEGEIKWNPSSSGEWSLNIDLAMNIVVAGMDKPFKGSSDAPIVLNEMFTTIGEAYKHVQAATYALVYSLLWNRLHE